MHLLEGAASLAVGPLELAVVRVGDAVRAAHRAVVLRAEEVARYDTKTWAGSVRGTCIAIFIDGRRRYR